MNKILLRGVIVGGLAGLLFGFDTAVVAGTTEGLTNQFGLSPAQLGMTVSSALWGTLIGAIIAGIPGDKYGARNCLQIIASFYIISAILCYFAPNLQTVIFARILAGIAIGASSVLAPTYLAEIAPSKQRGALVGAFQFNIVAGILIAYLSNYVIGLLNLGQNEWRIKFAIAALPSIILFSLVFSIPNSPRWLSVKGRKDEARDILKLIGDENSEETLSKFEKSNENHGTKLNFKSHAKPMLLAFGIAAFNQLSGINAILYYLNDIFKAAGFGKVSADAQSVLIGATNLCFTLLALLVIDKVGRRKLLILGSYGLIIALSATAYIQLSGQFQFMLLWMLILFIASFAFSQGAVIWVYISEIFPTEVRARGQSLGSSTHWLFDALIAMAFPIIAAKSHGLPFVFFAIMMVLQLFVISEFFPETKGIILEDMEKSI